MALQLYVKLQTPTIELPVKVKDSSGAKDSILAGFKRYPIHESQAKLDTLSELIRAESDEEADHSEINKMVKSELVYLKQIKLDLEEDGRAKELAIPDTKSVKPHAGLWETSDECLAVLLDLYLNSAPYRLALILTMQKAFINSDFSAYKDAQVKNL